MENKVSTPRHIRTGSWWPVLALIILIGFLEQNWNANGEGVVTGGDQVAIFSKRIARMETKDFRSTEAFALFGSNRLDLTGVEVSVTKPKLEAVAVFGKVEIVLPPGWQIDDGDRVMVFGKIHDQIRRRGDSDGPRVRLEAVAVFGKVIIRN